MERYAIENIGKKVISALYAVVMLVINLGKVAIHLFGKTRNKNKFYAVGNICTGLLGIVVVIKLVAIISPASLYLVYMFSFLAMMVIGIYALAEVRGF